MQLRDMKGLLVEIGLPEVDAEKQLGLLIVLVNKKIQGLGPKKALPIVDGITRNYLNSLMKNLPLSKKFYIEQIVQKLNFMS